MTTTIDEHVEAAIVKAAVDLANRLKQPPQFVELGTIKPELEKYRLCMWTRMVYEKQEDGAYDFKGYCDLSELKIGSFKVHIYEGSSIQSPSEYTTRRLTRQ